MFEFKKLRLTRIVILVWKVGLLILVRRVEGGKIVFLKMFFLLRIVQVI